MAKKVIKMRYSPVLVLVSILYLSLFSGRISHAQSIPTGIAISIDDILKISKNIGGFLFTLGGILAGITIVISGMMYFFAGSDTQKIGTAKGILKGGIVGSLILFGVGSIIGIIKALATNPLQFFQ